MPERQLRLCSGLIMIVWVIPHLLNVALPLWSAEAAEWFHRTYGGRWHHPALTLLLYGALLLHMLLGLYALWKRTTLRMPVAEALQLVFGLLVAPLLIMHLVDTRLDAGGLPAAVDFSSAAGQLWYGRDRRMYLIALVILFCVHLAVGVGYRIRTEPGRRHWLPYSHALLLVLGILSISGFVHSGRDLLRAYESAGADLALETVPASAAVGRDLLLLYVGALVLVLLFRRARYLYKRRGGSVHIRHPRHGIVNAHRGQTLLEALRQSGISHPAICGGRGRCSTCQVLVVGGYENVEPVMPAERKVLAGIAAPASARLACQLRVRGDISIVPLLAPQQDPAGTPGGMFGTERMVAVVFVDLRDSSRLGETRLPYDVVFILNRFFGEMTAALEETGGHYAQFNGDGLMALYGLKSDINAACRDALHGVQRMTLRLQALNGKLVKELKTPLRMGVGIHSGEAIVGRMGPPQAPVISAIGDNVNIAARLEQQTKALNCGLVISRISAERAGLCLDDSQSHRLELPGRSGIVDVCSIGNPADIRFESSTDHDPALTGK